MEAAAAAAEAAGGETDERRRVIGAVCFSIPIENEKRLESSKHVGAIDDEGYVYSRCWPPAPVRRQHTSNESGKRMKQANASGAPDAVLKRLARAKWVRRPLVECRFTRISFVKEPSGFLVKWMWGRLSQTLGVRSRVLDREMNSEANATVCCPQTQMG